MKDIIKRFTAMAMAAEMAWAITIPCTAADDAYIYLRNAADIKDLADKCMIDNFSAGKTVVLDADIDVSTTDFEYIPYFCGTFEGGGHTISGFEMEADDPERGFIGTVGETGIIKDLNVLGKITKGSTDKDGAKNKADKLLSIIDDLNGNTKDAVDRIFNDTGLYSVGGLAGINKGTITGCSFEGSVDFEKNTGGIAGVNEGRIETCVNRAAIKSEENTGGIAGKNKGIIKWCVNSGKINDTAVEGMYATGGIAGFSEGVIEACTNTGSIGYKNTGSATGGICGAQSGNVSECRNQGIVYGKKRVGGIVGNFEPYTNITYNPDEISERIDKEKEKIKNDLDDIEARIEDNRQKMKTDLDDLDGRLRKIFGVDDITEAIGDANDNLSAFTDSITDLNGTISDKIANGNSLASMADSIERLSGTVSDKVANGNSLESIADSIAKAEEDMSENNGEIRDLLVEARNTAKTVSDTTADISGSFKESNDQLSSLLGTVNDDLSDSERRDRIYDTLDSVNDALDSTSKAMDNLSTLKIPTLRIGVLEETDTQLAKALKKINNELDGLLDPFIRINSGISDVLDRISERKAKLEELKKTLEEELEGILPTLAPVYTSLPIVTSQPDTAFDPFFVTAKAADNENKDKTTLERLLDMDIHDIDIPLERSVCGESYEMAVVHYCINEAEVTGTSDIGGISGGVGFGAGIGGSFGNINSDGKEFSLNPSTAIKSVISACINEGGIAAKNSYAGGITGFSDLGKIKDCINSGDIAVTEGGYAGGVSGYDLTEIMRCINIGDVDAKSDIGGIAGYGKNISQTYSMTRTSSDCERKGAVAGTVSGDLEHNYFLKEKLGGINGVDYNDKAQPVSKEVLAVDGDISEELSGLEARYWKGTSGDLYMPQLTALAENNAKSISDLIRAKSAACALFRFTVNFIVGGESVKTMNFDYGEKIPADQIPDIPKEDGKYGEWDKDVKAPIIRNTEFTAVYNKSKATLSYGGEPPQLLVEGDFDPGAELVVEEFDPEAVISDPDYDPTVGYSFMVMQKGEKYEGDMIVHVRLPKDKSRMKAGLITENSVVIADSSIDGSYMIFDANGAERFILMRVHRSPVPYIAVMAGIVGVLFLMFLFRKRIRERRLLKAIRSVAERINIPALPSSSQDDMEELIEESTFNEEEEGGCDGEEEKQKCDKIGEYDS